MLYKKIEKFIERYAPFCLLLLVTLISLGISYKYSWHISSNKFILLLNMSLALSSIYLGFIGAIIGSVISIVNSKLMNKIYEYNADKDLINYIKHAAISCIVLFCTSVVLLLVNCDTNDEISFLSFSIWLGVFISTFLYAIRIIYFLFLMMRIIIKQQKIDNNTSQPKEQIPPSAISRKPSRDNPFE